MAAGTNKKIRFNYPGPEIFIRDYPMLKEGRIFLPGTTLGKGISFDVDLAVPGIGDKFTFTGTVTWSSDGSDGQAAGTWMDISSNPESAFTRMEMALSNSDLYCGPLKLRPPLFRESPPEVKSELLIELLSSTEKSGLRKYAIDALCSLNETALEKIRRVLDDTSRPWFLRRNALLILGTIGKGDGDANRARRFLSHSHPRIREEALHTLVQLKGRAAEREIMTALYDPDVNVVRRAVTSLIQIKPVSSEAQNKVMDILDHTPVNGLDPTQTVKHSLLERGLSAIRDNPVPAGVALFGEI